MIQNARDNRIDAHGLSASRRARNQKMRHFREIGDDRAARDVFSEGDRDAAARLLEFLRIQDIAQRHFRRFGVWHFDAHGRFPRNGRFDANICRRERHRDIILQTQNPAHFHAHRRLDFILRHGGPRRRIRDPHVHAETFECRLQKRRIFLRVHAPGRRLAPVKQSQWRKLVCRPFLRRRCLIRFFGFLRLLFLFRLQGIRFVRARWLFRLFRLLYRKILRHLLFRHSFHLDRCFRASRLFLFLIQEIFRESHFGNQRHRLSIRFRFRPRFPLFLSLRAMLFKRLRCFLDTRFRLLAEFLHAAADMPARQKQHITDRECQKREHRAEISKNRRKPRRDRRAHDPGPIRQKDEPSRRHDGIMHPAQEQNIQKRRQHPLPRERKARSFVQITRAEKRNRCRRHQRRHAEKQMKQIGEHLAERPRRRAQNPRAHENTGTEKRHA